MGRNMEAVLIPETVSFDRHPEMWPHVLTDLTSRPITLFSRDLLFIQKAIIAITEEKKNQNTRCTIDISSLGLDPSSCCFLGNERSKLETGVLLGPFP